MPRKARATHEEFLKSERGTIKKDWRDKIRVALVYPNLYHVGMSNLGFQSVYGLINTFDDIVCERVFLREEENRTKEPPRSIESDRKLTDFDIVAFSTSFENDYLNLITILAEAGVPLLSSERLPPSPLIIAGGVTNSLNPEPLAPFIDCFIIGEAESILPSFFDTYRKHKRRDTLLESLAIEVPGIYVPAFYGVSYHADGTIREFFPKEKSPAKIRRVFLEDLSFHNTCSTVLTPHTTFGDTYLIEAVRGCPHGCRFCAAGFVYRPPRFRTSAQLERSMDEAALYASKVGLVAAAIADIPSLESFCSKAISNKLQVSFSSLRADLLTPNFVDLLKHTATKTATIAPDAGSQRMRRVINKGISEEDIFESVEMLVKAGILNLRLYFMVGLPGETMSDVEAIIALCNRIKHHFLKASRPMARLGQIIVSLNSFVPKPFTPFQWVPLENIKELKTKIRHVQKGLRRVPNVRVHADLPRWAYIQALLSRGDRRAAKLLLLAHANNGNWAKTLKDSIINPDFYVYRKRSVDEILPWDFIDHGLKKSFLLEEYQKALQEKSTPPCNIGQCKACGVCT